MDRLAVRAGALSHSLVEMLHCFTAVTGPGKMPHEGMIEATIGFDLRSTASDPAGPSTRELAFCYVVT